MKKSRFTEQQIAFALQQAEGGTSVEEVCRKMGISQATFFRWKKVYGGLMPSELRRLKQLEEENGRLRKLVADLTLDKEMLTEVIKNVWPAPSARGDIGMARSVCINVSGLRLLPGQDGYPRALILTKVPVFTTTFLIRISRRRLGRYAICYSPHADFICARQKCASHSSR